MRKIDFGEYLDFGELAFIQNLEEGEACWGFKEKQHFLQILSRDNRNTENNGKKNQKNREIAQREEKGGAEKKKNARVLRGVLSRDEEGPGSWVCPNRESDQAVGFSVGVYQPLD